MSSSEMSEPDKNGNEKSSHPQGKIQRTLDSMLKQMQLSEEEMKYRMENFENVDVVKEYMKYLQCTKCNLKFLRFITRGGTVGIHPVLGVLMCGSCCDYYGDGNFSLDSEGEDKYCRWCGEGGTIFACSKCICGFCDVCITKHFGQKGLEEVKKDDDWICYFCNPKPLWYLRSICYLAKEAAKKKRDHLKMAEQGRSVKKKRRLMENDKSDVNKASSDSSSSSNSSKSSSNIKKKQPKRRVSKVARTKRKESSSSESEKDNHVNFRKRVKIKKQVSPGDATKESPEIDTKDSKKSKDSDHENDDLEVEKKRKFLQKLTSIWRLTQTITEVGMNSSRAKVKILAKSEKFRTVEQLKNEHEDLKSCMNVLVSSLSTASNSVDSIREDLSFDMTKDETESFRSQEIKLKTFADKFHEESDDKASVDSEGDSFRKELKRKSGGKKRVRKKMQSFKEEGCESKKNSDDAEENCARENISKSLFSDSGSDKEEKGGGSERSGEMNTKDRVSCEESIPVKPLLKVKSFARMLDENVYDTDKGKKEGAPVVIDLYDIDTDDSENETKNKGPLDKSLSRGKEQKPEDESKKEQNCVNDEQDKGVSGERKGDESVCNNASSKFVKSSEDDTIKTSSTDTGMETTVNETKKKKRGFDNKIERKSSNKDEDEKSSDEKSEDGKSEREVGKKSLSENKKNTSGHEDSSSSESESEKEPQGEKTANRQLSDDKSQESESVSETGGTTKGKENNKELSTDESGNRKEALEEINDRSIEPDDNEQSDKGPVDDSEEGKKKNVEPSEDENEEKGNKESRKSEEDPGESDEEGPKKKQGNKTTSDKESEDKKESTSSEKEVVKKTSSKNKKNDSSDSDSTSGEEGNTKITRKSHKKELKTPFDEYKRKRERFLKSSKENSQPESEKEVKAKRVLDSSESENEVKEPERKSKRQKKKLILASSDEENETKKATSSEETEKKNQNDKSDSEVTKPSSESSSEEEVEKKKRKRIRKRSSDSSGAENKEKKKRRQSSSSSESSEDEKTKKNKKGRKNIKKILKKDSLQVETKEALKNESERKKRLKERQKLFEEFFPQKEGEEPKELILDFNAETKEPLVAVHKKLVKKLKPHQMKGVKFMWDNCFETVQKLEEESGSGCILAHCMGLGKTLQVITLVHTVMTHDLGVNSVLIVCPLSTVSNWIREFETWLEKIHTEPITLFDLLKYKREDERIFHMKDWHENGGVLVMSYDLFRNLTKNFPKGKQKRAKYRKVFEMALLDPGPDLVVCDEGHLLKNEDTALSRCMSRVKTSRRIILTGTPLQNNLVEYHCMVQFVKPNILGTRKEFCNRFVNPINNGQFEDSTDLDVKIMKRRSHVLHSMLDGCIQRFDYSVLTPFLPEKQEYVLAIALTESQVKAYLHFINNLSAKSFGNSRVASLFQDYHSLQRIWTHPRTMLMQSEKEAQKEVLGRDDEGSLKDFVVSSDEESEKSGSESSDDPVEEVAPRRRILRSNANDPELKKALEEEEKLQNRHWWDEFFNEKAYDDLRESNKLVVLFSLLKYCGQKKDKILVFSQSLYSLDLIEYFLSKVDESNKQNDETLCGHRDTWELGSDYFRLDGSTNSETRAMWCKYFNKDSNTRARLFLISTKAGGLGINLYGANRVVIFDASWNPSHDLQSIFRVYRFGQKKPCYIYRFLAEATMEEKIYERQVTKLSLAHRVVDEHQIERHYTMGNLQDLYTFQPTPKDQRKVPKLPKDPVLADILAEHKEIIVGYHEHDSLLENKQEEELSEEERKAAWKEYEEEKIQKAFINPMLLPQGPYPQGGMGMPGFNPAVMNQGTLGPTFINPLYLQSNFPHEALQRGLSLGVTPLPSESVESYLTRIYSREAWMQVGQQRLPEM